MTLVRIESDVENQCILDIVKSTWGFTAWAWLAAKRIETGGSKWTWNGVDSWTPNDKTLYQNWNVEGVEGQQPENYGGNEDCVTLKANKNGTWFDLPCTYVRYFICEASN